MYRGKLLIANLRLRFGKADLEVIIEDDRGFQKN